MATVDVTRIASNIGALNALNSLQNINKQLATHQTRLSTGKRINSAADDPAGLTIATKMLARSEGLKVALNNIGDANNMLSVAEAGLSKMNDILVQMRSKAEQAASDTLGQTERSAIQTQLSAYAAQIDDIVNETKWNNVKLLDGTVSKQFQTGADQNEVTKWNLAQAHTAGTGGLNVSEVKSTLVSPSTDFGATKGINTLTATSTPMTGFSALQTGQYKISLTGAADVGGTFGTVNNAGELGTVAGTVLFAAVAPDGANELSNGTHSLNISAFTSDGSAGSITYSIDGGTSQTLSGIDTTGAFNLSANGAAAATTENGIKLTIGATFDPDAAGAVTTVSFDYIKKGNVQAQLSTADGTVQNVNNGGKQSQYFYLDAASAGTPLDIGRGMTVTGESFATMHGKVGTDYSFGYQAQSSYFVDVSTAQRASNYMGNVNNAMNTVNDSMASLGSLMARLTFKEEQIATAQVNVESSYSRIMNANMAEEQVNASKFTILQQTATAMLAQANQAPQSLLSLFR